MFRRSLTVLAAWVLMLPGPLALAQTVVPISQLPAVSSPLTGSELVPCVQGGVTKSCPASALAAVGFGRVASKSALAALASTAYPGVIRLGYNAAGDTEPLVYTPSNSACSLNAGAGDGGSQVPSSDGKCWIWSPPSGGVTSQEFGAVGNGSTDDTSAVQAAINATEAASIPLRFDTLHLYKITAALNVTSPLDIEGPVRYGVWGTDLAATVNDCPWGIVNAGTGINGLNVTAKTVTIRGLCIDMTGQGGTGYAGSGAAINLAPANTSSYQSGVIVQFNTIYNPYDGIDANGAGMVVHCCGEGTTADQANISYNTISSPYHAGISVGKNTANAATSGLSFVDNNILCNSSPSRANAYGFVVYDGNITYDGTNNGPELCHIGMAMIPGDIGGQQQFVGGKFQGVVGDNSGAYDLLMQPQTTDGLIQFVQCIACWASSFAYSAPSVLIDVNTHGGMIENVHFTDLVAKLSPAQAVPGVDIEGGAGTEDLHDIAFVGGSVCYANTVGTAPLIKLNLLGNNGASDFHFVGMEIGHGCPGISVGAPIGIQLNISNPAVGNILIEGNDFYGVQGNGGTPISWTPVATNAVVIKNNLGIDDEVGSVTDAATLALTPNFPVYAVTGTGAAVTTISGGWPNREVKLITTGGSITFSTGGNLCNGLTSGGANASVTALYNQANACWFLK